MRETKEESPERKGEDEKRQWARQMEEREKVDNNGSEDIRGKNYFEWRSNAKWPYANYDRKGQTGKVYRPIQSREGVNSPEVADEERMAG